jgi:hypothetical protein
LAKKKRPSKKAESAAKALPEKKASAFDFLEKASVWHQVILTLLLLLAFTYAVFWLNITKNYDFILGGDNLAAAPIAKMGEDFQDQGGVPNWCPYIFCGMPMVGSLLYANDYYFAFREPFKTLISLPYISSSSGINKEFGWLFFHYILAGFGVFLLLRFFKVNWVLAAIFGLLFAFNPPMVVFADVGHGSKVMTIAYLPWILYFTIRLFRSPRLLWGGLLALFYGLQMLALHMQIAYYGAMMMGLYAVYAFISGGKADLTKNVKATLLMTAALIIAFALASPLYLQILEYSDYSIRGGGASGGAVWEYATAWSFHPLESLTYVFPSFFGYGGGTYWGFMPFTDMPVYWGALVLLFVPWAIFLKRDRLTIFLIILALAAWVVSFGKFLPILYRPLYELLPFFNKFRVPSLIQVLVLLAMIVLAGRGLQAVFDRLKSKTEDVLPLAKKFLIAGSVIAGICLLLIVLQGALKPVFLRWISASRPQMSPADASAAFAAFIGDAGRLLLFVVVLYGASYLALSRKASVWILVAAVFFTAAFELLYFDRKLLHPTPPQYMESYLQADDVVRFLQNQEEPFRIYPLSQSRNPDWYMPHRLESVDGYSAVKLRLYQTARDSLSLNNPQLLKLMNTVYFISDRPIQHPDLEEVFKGQRERVYRYKPAFPRAFLVNKAIRVNSESEVFNFYRRRDFDFSQTAVLENDLSMPLDLGSSGTVRWVNRQPDRLELEVETDGRQLLVLSEVYYPSGWKAAVDGAETPILKTDYLFRGIEIPPGKHNVVLNFKPLSADRGHLLRWFAAVLIIAALGWELLRLKGKKAA